MTSDNDRPDKDWDYCYQEARGVFEHFGVAAKADGGGGMRKAMENGQCIMDNEKQEGAA